MFYNFMIIIVEESSCGTGLPEVQKKGMVFGAFDNGNHYRLQFIHQPLDVVVPLLTTRCCGSSSHQ